MAIAALKAILDRIDKWPAERQERAADLLAVLEAGDDDDVQVSDEDLAEIDRRIADVDAPTMSLEEFRTFVDQLVSDESRRSDPSCPSGRIHLRPHR